MTAGLHTVGRWTRDRARADSSAVAVDDRGVALSYRELDDRSVVLAERLLASGHRPGDRIATLTGNSADQVVLFFACAHAGLVLVPLSWRLAPSELASQLADAEPALLCVEEEFEVTARAALAQLRTPVATSRLGAAGIESELPSVRPPVPARPVADDDPLLMIYTSGTMRSPRGAVLSHANCFWTSLSLSRTLELSRHDVVLSVLPQYHVGGWTIQALLAWWTGACVVLERTFDAGRVLRLIREKRITTMMGVPANYLFLAQHPQFAEADLSSLRYAVVGGAPMPEPLLRTWLARDVRLAQGYGLTEASPNVLCLMPEDAGQRLGWAGTPYPHVEVAVADPVSGELLEGPAEGELLVRGPNVFSGYWRDPEATAFVLRGGWLHTGDLVHRAGDGYFRILDRVDDIYITGGENVSPIEVESVLFEHRAVADAAVVGRSDSRWGEVGLAYVVMRPGSHTDAEELQAHCRARLAGYKAPHEVVFVDELPRSAVGKVLRRTLRERQEAPR
ncbi:MAG TPA: AMP-binding protein [Jatrophihabitans sp.]|uniref:class I adenylate-forming enzyme family protein n=1 Tax=Jatrophihabitans sp. TaxID=1932789 RepID=UPI002EF4BD9F